MSLLLSLPMLACFMLKTLRHEESYPYNGLMLHGKKATEKTNWEADGDSWSLSLSWYETAVHTNDLNPCFFFVVQIKTVESTCVTRNVFSSS